MRTCRSAFIGLLITSSSIAMLEVGTSLADSSSANEVWDRRLACCTACGNLIGRICSQKRAEYLHTTKFLFLSRWRHRISVFVFLLHCTVLRVGQSLAASQQTRNAVTGYFVRIMFLKYFSQGGTGQGTFVFHGQVSIENTWLYVCTNTSTLFGLCFRLIKRIKEVGDPSSIALVLPKWVPHLTWPWIPMWVIICLVNGWYPVRGILQTVYTRGGYIDELREPHFSRYLRQEPW
jgi:hypothetical protein